MSTSPPTETGLTDSARRAYGTSRISDWTRVKMLIALYDAAISNAEQALHNTEAGDENAAITHRLRASQIVFGLEAGLDHKMGEIPQHIDRLCQYVRTSLSEGTPAKLRSALRVLSLLREGFAGIQNDVNDPHNSTLAEDVSIDLTA